MKAYPAGKSHPFKSVNPNAGGLTHGLAFTDVLEQLFLLTGKTIYMDYCLFLYQDFSQQVLNEDAQLNKLLNRTLPLQGHGVHTFEHLRSVAAAYYASGNPVLGQALNSFIRKIENTLAPSGGPIGDEYIRGRKANADIGYEYCSLHELMAGWISLLAKTSQARFAEQAEHLLFNAALGNTHPTESAICYLKQDNAYVLQGGNNGDTTDQHQTRYRYSPLHREAAVCCVPNAGRIFPFFVQNMWMKDAKGLSATLLGPCELHTTLGNSTITILQQSEFPFENQLRYTITNTQPQNFELRIRKPLWATAFHASLPCVEENGFLVFRQIWKDTTQLTITFSSEISVKKTHNGEFYFQSGPFVLCHELEAQPSVTKTWNNTNLKETAYLPVKKLIYRYTGGKLAPKHQERHHFQAPMLHPETGKIVPVLLQPMARTILRQVSFPFKTAR